jgi:hypothetical protein
LASVRFVGVLCAALILAPHLTRDAGAQIIGPPQFLSATVLGSGVTLRWQPPAVVPPGLTGYLVEAGASPQTTSVSLPINNVLTYFVNAPNGRYFVRVRALVGSIAGEASNEIEVIVPPIPAAPINVVATVERFTVNVTWNYGFGSSAVTGWQIHAGSAPGLSDLAIVTQAGGGLRPLSATVAEGTYYVRIVALNESGASAPSEEIVIRTGPNICNLPSVPTGFGAVARQGGVLLSWNAWSGYLPTGYLLAVGSSAGASDIGTFALPLITVFNAVAPPATYYVRLAAYNGCGQSPFTPDVFFTVLPRASEQ